MQRFLKRALPFFLTLTVGTFASSFASRLFSRTRRDEGVLGAVPPVQPLRKSPIIRLAPRPRYAKLWDDTVVADVELRSDGRVGRVESLTNLEYTGFERDILKAADGIVFDPATINGR